MSEELIDILLLRNYNTRLVILSTSLLGMVSGVVGAFLLLRKRSLMGDALSHATLPGVCIAFALMVACGGTGKSTEGLWLGATLSGVLGVGTMLLIVKTTRLQDDVAMGLVLSIFFGAGVAILSSVQNMPAGSAAGLESYIYGKTASILYQDFLLIIGVCILGLVVSLLLIKELTLLCFDEHFGSVQGFPMIFLDIVLLTLVTLVTVAGLQSVGLILMIALFIIPATAARFWVKRLWAMVLLSSILGFFSGWIGGAISAFYSKLPAGSVIVLVAAFFFLLSMFFAPAKGVVPRFIRRRRFNHKIGEQHVLRAIYEILEEKTLSGTTEKGEAKARQQGRGGRVQNSPVTRSTLQSKRSWSQSSLTSLVRRVKGRGFLETMNGESLQLTEEGFGNASRITRNHRLWEVYLVTHAEIAPSHVDRDADMIEHVLNPELVARLESELEIQHSWTPIIHSPHKTSER